MMEMSEMMQWIEDPNMPKERRKRRVPPPMPTIPKDRIAEVRTLLTDLAELYDFGHYDVYDSVFFQRTCEYMAGVSFEGAPPDGACMRMRDLGTEIILSQSTSTKTFIGFFKSIIDFWNDPS
jgi:hypothetical protein